MQAIDFSPILSFLPAFALRNERSPGQDERVQNADEQKLIKHITLEQIIPGSPSPPLPSPCPPTKNCWQEGEEESFVQGGGGSGVSLKLDPAPEWVGKIIDGVRKDATALGRKFIRESVV